MERNKIKKPKSCNECSIVKIKKNAIACPCLMREVLFSQERELYTNCPLNWDK